MTSRGLLPGKAIWETFAVVSIRGPWRRGPERTTPVQTLHDRRWRVTFAWELSAELTNSIRVQFRYKSAQVVDRQATPDSKSVAAHAELAEVGIAA
jgi:hypothetical protein